ncbi:MAG: phosphate/phosphite/phosphonate ABC transporter substrate-binding protein [Nitrospirae bacterium]|nr:phosphate/phosphite/phosphonate ABC transporter substrate-binding protein [Nitrospirota bacterium]
MKKIVIAFFIYLAVLSGCDKKETPPSVRTSEKETFVIGLIPEQNIFRQIERYEPLAAYLSEKVGLRVKLKVLPRYGNIIDNFVSEGMDGAFFGSFTYVLAHSKLGLEVLARPVADDGQSTYHGLIFVRKDSGIKNAKDMKGKIFAFVDKATTAGFILPLAYFKKNDIESYKTYLKEGYFSGTHEDVIYDVLNRKADIGAAKNTVYARLAGSDVRIQNELTVLEKSPDVPENGLAVKKSIDSSVKNRITEVLLNMHNDTAGRRVLEKFGALKFIETSNDDYAPVFKYADQIGLDLSSYDYINY